MTAKVWSGIGAALMGLGVLVGLVPVTSAGADCGSALLQEERLSVALVAGEAAADSCQSLLSVLVIPVWALIGLGLLAFGMAFMRATSAAQVTQPH